MRVKPARYSERYLAQQPEDVRRAIIGLELDKEFGRVEGWASSLNRKYTDTDEWRAENLILTYWRIACRYSHAAGKAATRFLDGLRDGKILGTKCGRCQRVMIPPRLFCEWCFRDVDEWVEHSGEGAISTYSLSYIGTDPGVRLEKPIIVAVIWFDNTSKKSPSSQTVLHAAGLLHIVDGVKPENVSIGMRVRPVWRRDGERTGSILDIAYFTPVDGGVG
ncbi:hypothetical protein HRbin01_00011 [archaeon HR01]|nr:hypothetical protein HRbin01_00011 [archaeon HR01]